MPYVIVKNVTRTEIVGGASCALDCGIALQMTLNADCIAALRGQPRRTHHSCCTVHVRRSGTVATLTTNPGLRKKRRRVAVLCAIQGLVHTACMAAQAVRIGGEGERDFARAGIG